MTTPTYDLLEILQTLSGHQVDYVIVGGIACVVQGAPIDTFDLDVVHSRTPENLGRLLSALQVLDARFRDSAGRNIRPEVTHLASPGHQLLVTKAGNVDLLGTVGQGLSYDDLVQNALEMEIGPGLRARVLDLAKVIELKEQAGREKDKAVLPVLRRTLEEKRKG